MLTGDGLVTEILSVPNRVNRSAFMSLSVLLGPGSLGPRAA